MSIAMPHQAMVLAAGLGKRMRPLTDHIPKPMIKVAGKTLIDRAIDALTRSNVTKIIVNISYKAELLEAHLDKQRAAQIIVSRETIPLETGGGIAQALSHFDNRPFFAVNGDIIWLDGKIPALERLAAAWEDTLDALLLLHPVAKAIGYDGKGDFFLTSERELIRRGEKPKADYVYGGIQLLHPRLFAECPEGAFSLNLLYDRAMAQKPARIKAIIHDGAWLHVGDPAGRDEAEAYILNEGSK